MKNKKIRTEESLENFCTDLAEYNFILEQEYKKKSYTSTIKKNKKEEMCKKINLRINLQDFEKRCIHLFFFFFFKIFLLFFKA